MCQNCQLFNCVKWKAISYRSNSTYVCVIYIKPLFTSKPTVWNMHVNAVPLTAFSGLWRISRYKFLDDFTHDSCCYSMILRARNVSLMFDDEWCLLSFVDGPQSFGDFIKRRSLGRFFGPALFHQSQHAWVHALGLFLGEWRSVERCTSVFDFLHDHYTSPRYSSAKCCSLYTIVQMAA